MDEVTVGPTVTRYALKPEQVAEFIQKISQLKREHFNETPQVNND
jgi:hypothetical protein